MNFQEDNIVPIVQLQQVPVFTGEDDEDLIIDFKAKLYWFDTDSDEWKDRGTGIVKLLRHGETGKVRFLMRQSKTLQIIANHFILPAMSVQEHACNNNCCVWHATNFADDDLKDELFCIRTTSITDRIMFMETFQQIAEAKNNEENQDGNL